MQVIEHNEEEMQIMVTDFRKGSFVDVTMESLIFAIPFFPPKM